MAVIHSIDEGGGKIDQIVGEEITYTVDVARFASAPATPTVTVLDLTSNRDDVSDTVLSGSPSVTDTVITLPTLGSLIGGHRYLIRVKFSEAGNQPIVQFIVTAIE